MMTRLFIELWAMANQNEFVAERVEMAYRHVHLMIEAVVAELNPALFPPDVAAVVRVNWTPLIDVQPAALVKPQGASPRRLAYP